MVIADVGCGTGSLTFELARFARTVIGIDQSREMLQRAKSTARSRNIQNVEFRIGNALKLPLKPRSFDAAFSVMVLHFLPEPERAISELCRIVRPGGTVVVLDLVRHQQEWMRDQMAHRWLGFDRESVESWFGKAGVTDVKYELTGAYAGEKLARNGNRPAEIFIARACLPMLAKKQRESES
jgi:ArsR family transcriptional regulator